MLIETLFNHAGTKPDALAIIDDTGRYTYRQLAAMAGDFGKIIATATKKPQIGILLPSGAGFVASFYGVLAAFLVAHFYDWRQRTACLVGGFLAVALVAFSRMYLGAHYLSDILAAACSSLVWLVLSLSAVHAYVRRRMARTP